MHSEETDSEQFTNIDADRLNPGFVHLNASDNTESKSQGELVCILPASTLRSQSQWVSLLPFNILIFSLGDRIDCIALGRPRYMFSTSGA